MMRCSHCGSDLTDQERARSEQTQQVTGVRIDLCTLCWDAWGEMTFGWQAGVPSDQRVVFSERSKRWDARQK